MNTKTQVSQQNITKEHRMAFTLPIVHTGLCTLIEWFFLLFHNFLHCRFSLKKSKLLMNMYGIM